MDIDHNILVTYFKYLADNYILLKGFFRMDLTEIQGAFRSKADFPCMVLESHEGDLGKSSKQSTVNDRTFAFTIYTKPKKADYDNQNEKLALAEQIGLAIIARMKHDATVKDHLIYNKFLVADVSYAKVGPVFNEQLYGYRFIGSIAGAEPLKYNKEDWLDNPDKCE